MSISLSSLQSAFIGLDTEYPLADGRRTRRRYLDSAASSLMLEPAWRTAEAFLRHYANTHSDLHFGARIATHAYAWAHERALTFVGADPAKHACAFVGSGSTAGFNRLARMLKDLRPERTTVLVAQSSRPVYWRANVLDRFNGLRWETGTQATGAAGVGAVGVVVGEQVE